MLKWHASNFKTLDTYKVEYPNEYFYGETRESIGIASKAPITITSLLDCIMGSDFAWIASTPMVESMDYDDNDEKMTITMIIRLESNNNVWKVYNRMSGFCIFFYNSYEKAVGEKLKSEWALGWIAAWTPSGKLNSVGNAKFRIVGTTCNVDSQWENETWQW